MVKYSPLWIALLACMLILAVSCATYNNGGQPSADQTVQVFNVTLSDGTTMECISSDTYGDHGVLDCDWASRRK